MLTKKHVVFVPELSPYREVSKHNKNKLYFCVFYMFQEYVCPILFKNIGTAGRQTRIEIKERGQRSHNFN